ncbi:multimerin-2a [Osmerus eperlanus]|uniref:multimerin-2a n=1 Tax=Osmerus eperlanus TaxID=29151 RepID=UPI002E15ABC6
MTAVGEFVLVLGLLVTAHCAVRARDPEVEDEEDLDRGSWQPGVGRLQPGSLDNPPQLQNIPGYGHRPDANGPSRVQPQDGHEDGHPLLGIEEEVAPKAGEGGNYPARTGNWCAFVSRRVVTVPVACGKEQYTIKSQSRCPTGTPDCQLVMYKLSTRPVYREKQTVITALLWRCCPGHAGQKCEETVAEGHVPDPADPTLTAVSLPGNTGYYDTAAQSIIPHLAGEVERVQNDFQASSSQLYDGQPLQSHDNDTDPASAGSSHHPGHGHDLRHGNPHSGHPHPHPTPVPHNPHLEDPFRGPHQEEVDRLDPYPATLSPHLVSHVMERIMDQLRPALEGFNRTLEHLTQEVRGLSQEMAMLRSTQWDVQEEALGGAGAGEAPEAKLEETFQHIEEVRRQLANHQAEMQDRLHSQHVMLHHNLTSFKTDMDMKLKRNHKMLQVSLQTMNVTLSDMRLEQERLNDELLRDLSSVRDGQRTSAQTPAPLQPPHHTPLSLDDSSLWEAIARLDNKVINNTVKVDSLVEDLETAQENIRDLKKTFWDLEKDIVQTGRNSQVQFMETVLEVEAAKVTVVNQVSELAGNLTKHTEQLQEMEIDLDYLYSSFYKNVSNAGECNCKAYALAIANLKQGLANVTELANDNRLVLDGNSETGADNWVTDGVWGPSVEELHQGLQQVRESLAFEQERTRTLHHNVSQLATSSEDGKRDVTSLREADVRLQEEMRHLASSFTALLKDALRHTDVLEMLLGEEVLEFLDWPLRDREAHSIPALKDMIHHMKEQIKAQNLSLASLLGTSHSDTPAADQPSVLADWASRGQDRSVEQMRIHQTTLDAEDYSDRSLWSLEKSVEELGMKVRQLEERPCPSNCSRGREAPTSGEEATLQAEVVWLRRGLEDHLRVFKNVFSNSEGLEGSESTVDLDKLWAMLKKKEGKKTRKEKKEGGRVNMRSRRDTSVHPKIPNNVLLFLADSFSRVSEKNLMLFESALLNHDQAYSTTTGVFKAPAKGVYLFVLTLDFRPGPTLVVLRRQLGDFAIRYDEEAPGLSPVTRVALLQLERNEEMYLELLRGTLATEYPKKSSFAGLLLHQTT